MPGMIQDFLGIWYGIDNPAGAVFQDHLGVLYTIGGPGGTGPGSTTPGTGVFTAANQVLGVGGRLTLTTLTPVLTATVSAAGTVYYTPYPGAGVGNRIPIFDGTILQPWAFTELSNVLANSTVGSAGPAAAANTSVYDLYVWNNAGTLTLTRSPAWATAVTRGTGAGTAQQSATLAPGIITNAVAITNGPAAGRGTYVGTIATNGTATVDWIYGSIAAGWGMASHNVWNMHNRVQVGGFLGDSTDSWTYQLVQIRAANGNATARINAVFGLIEDPVQIGGSIRCVGGSTTTAGIVGVGLDSTTTYAQGIAWSPSVTNVGYSVPYAYVGHPGLGTHFLSANESCQNATNAATFSGDLGLVYQSGMNYSMRM